jgi:hypothetical protein
VTTLICGDLLAQSFGGSLDLLGIDGHACQFAQQLAAFLEADHRTYGAGHACEGGRQGGVFDTQLLIAGTKTMTARAAMIVGALQS